MLMHKPLLSLQLPQQRVVLINDLSGSVSRDLVLHVVRLKERLHHLFHRIILARFDSLVLHYLGSEVLSAQWTLWLLLEPGRPTIQMEKVGAFEYKHLRGLLEPLQTDRAVDRLFLMGHAAEQCSRKHGVNVDLGASGKSIVDLMRHIVKNHWHRRWRWQQRFYLLYLRQLLRLHLLLRV